MSLPRVCSTQQLVHGRKLARLLITSDEVQNLRQALLLLVVGAKVNRLQIDRFDMTDSALLTSKTVDGFPVRVPLRSVVCAIDIGTNSTTCWWLC